MPAVDLIPFSPAAHAEAAARLLVERHGRDRAQLPLLPPDDPEALRAALDAALARPHAGGFAAVAGDRLVGYMVGDLSINSIWGRSAWVRSAGFALAPDQSPELLRDLYAAVGERWVTWGCFTHFAQIPPSDPATIHAWFSLSFGIEQVHGLKPLAAPPTPDELPGLVLRRAAPDDRETLRGLSDLIWRHQAMAPVWGLHLPESEDPDGWAEMADDAENRVWLAFDGDRPVACVGWCPAEPGGGATHIPEQCVHLLIAGVRESHRGHGIARALRQRCEAEAQEAGYVWHETDWRSTNLLSSRAWPAEGFVPAVWRLVRRIDNRIAWGNGPLITAP